MNREMPSLDSLETACVASRYFQGGAQTCFLGIGEAS
jgi:hypothetical protein